MKANILRRALSIFSILVLLAALVVSTGYARARGSAMFQVPFDFVVAGKSLPAGKYVIERSTLFSAVGLSLRNVDRDEAHQGPAGRKPAAAPVRILPLLRLIAGKPLFPPLAPFFLLRVGDGSSDSDRRRIQLIP